MPDSQYVLDRDFKASIRLNMNHWLFKGLSGFLLHPKIKYPEDAWIADLGTGTAIWLQELAEDVKPPAKLVGFDTSPDQFPPTPWRMPNVELIVQDCINDPFPADHIGKYDVVAIKFFRCIIEGNDPVPLIKNAMTLLKPGGYLQWFEVLASRTEIHMSAGSVEAKSFQVMRSMSINPPQGNFPAQWIDELPDTFKENGLSIVAEEYIPMRDAYRAIWGQSVLALVEETTIGGMKKKQATEKRNGSAKTDLEFRDELDAAAKNAQATIEELSMEMSHGALVEHPVLCLVGRKP